ncbi:hypothetical protein NBRC116599_40150 [Aquicoccus sp. SU-CL01552]
MGQGYKAGGGGILTAGLAILLAVQVALAHVHSGAARTPGGLELVICSGDQVRTIILNPVDGSVDERPTKPDLPGEAECPLCITGATVLFEQPDRASVPAELHPLRYPLAARLQTRSARPLLTRAIRAPPSIV